MKNIKWEEYAEAHLAIARLPKKILKKTNTFVNKNGTRSFLFNDLNLRQITKLAKIAEEIYKEDTEG